MQISADLLEKTCMDIIETILLCLENATKGTIYRVGPMPELRTIRVTSGIREEESGVIRWGLPEASDYNYPGKMWTDYRDQPGRILEAMGWCVQTQKSWTSDNPYEDWRSVRKQLAGEPEDFHHMEPVLVHHKDLYGPQAHKLEYPLDWQGFPIWQNTEYVVVAVIKIHFLPYTIKRGDRSTKVIKKLSRNLATEMLSLHLRESYLKGREILARKRLQSTNVLAHELRNATVKLSFAFAAVNAELSFLREQWEMELRKAVPDLDDKRVILKRLNQLICSRISFLNGSVELIQLTKDLIEIQSELRNLYLLPEQEEKWVNNRIQPRWDRLLSKSRAWEGDVEEIQELLDMLRKAVWIGMDENLARKVEHLPEDLRIKWPKIVYTRFSPEKISLLAETLELLDHPELNIPHKQHSRKVFISLKALIEIIPEIEERSNVIISSLKSDDLFEEE